MLLTGAFSRAIDDKLRVAIPKHIRDSLAKSRGLLFVAPLLMKVVSPLILLVVGVHTKCDVTVTVAAPADANVAADNASPAAVASAAVRRLIAGRVALSEGSCGTSGPRRCDGARGRAAP